MESKTSHRSEIGHEQPCLNFGRKKRLLEAVSAVIDNVTKEYDRAQLIHVQGGSWDNDLVPLGLLEFCLVPM